MTKVDFGGGADGGRGSGDSETTDESWITSGHFESALAGADSSGPFSGQVNDPVNHPAHYTWLPNGVEVIDVTEQFNFNLGNALKYIMRCRFKGNMTQDLEKAQWYLAREIQRIGQSG